MPLQLIHNMTNPETGRTYKEDNLLIQHNIPLATLVEVEWNEWLGDGSCWSVKARLWVVKQDRDCDGTPLYSVGRYMHSSKIGAHHGFTEDRLTPIELTDGVIQGHDLPTWFDDSDLPSVIV